MKHWHGAGILKAIFGMQTAANSAFMTAKVFRRDENHIVYLETDSEVRSILELVVDITAKIGNMPAHAKGWKRAQNATGIEFPRMIGVVEIAVGGEVVMWNHTILAFLNIGHVKNSCDCIV